MLGQLLIATSKRISDFYPTPYTKVNSKWIRNLNGSTTTTKYLKENMGLNLHGLVNGFLAIIPKA